MDAQVNWDKVIDRLKAGWQKGNLGDYRSQTAPVCLRGAVCAVVIPDLTDRWMDAERVISQIALEQFPDRIPFPSVFPVPAFNDHPDTTLDDVILVCEKARANQ